VQLLPDQTAASVQQRVTEDPAFAVSLGNPTVNPPAIPGYDFVSFGYPPLEDLTIETGRVLQSGAFASAGQNQWICMSPPPMDRVAPVVEFYNTRLDHYFYTADAGEIGAIEAGRVGPEWMATGGRFFADVEPGCKFLPDRPVFRFTGVPGSGPSSHFFTIDRAECSVVRKTGQWSFEGLPFWAAPVAPDGTCSQTNLVPLIRIWRPFGDSNHRFTTDPAIAAQMAAKGWTVEGPAMCVRRPG
jgi:hypothetical protein